MNAFFAYAAECASWFEPYGVATFNAPRERQEAAPSQLPSTATSRVSMPYIVECKDCGVCTEPELWNRRAGSISQRASEQALAEAHAEIARLTAECERVKDELKEALVGVSYGRMCEKELFALRARRKA